MNKFTIKVEDLKKKIQKLTHSEIDQVDKMN